MIVVFDLDDTLYDESTYVASGFRAVSSFIAGRHGIDRWLVLQALHEELIASGRGKVFDQVLRRFGCLSAREVGRCLGVYRRHAPEISLWPEADACLDRLSPFPCYVVTDGNKLVQSRKLRALGLPARMRRCLPTHQYGRSHAKPSPACFLKIAAWEGVTPRDVVYVGDNPRKDFVGIKPLGFLTIRVRTGAYRHEKADANHEAHASLPSLEHLDTSFIAVLRQRAQESSW
jgi:putative hydrolase of the HAD superfamily